MVQMKWMVIGAVVWGLLAGPAMAAITWDDGAGGGDPRLWNTAANWNPDGVPTATDDVNLESSGLSSDANPIHINSAATCNNLTGAYNSGKMAYVEVNANFDVKGNWTVAGKEQGKVTFNSGTVDVGGNLSLCSRGGNPVRFIMDSSSTGTLNVTGDLYVTSGPDTGGDHRFIQQAGTVTIGQDLDTGSRSGDGYAAYELSGGSLTVTGGISPGWKAAGWVDFVQSGGTASAGYMDIGAPTNDPGHGRLILSDAAQLLTTTANGGSGTMEVGEPAGGGTGVVKLDGSKTGAGTDLAIAGDANFRAQGTLEAVIDQAAINTATDMRKIVVTGNATFDTGSTLKVSFDAGATPTPGTWTLMTVGGTLTDSGINLDADAGWSYTASSPLTVTYVPEPATLALLGLGGLALVLRRRR